MDIEKNEFDRAMKQLDSKSKNFVCPYCGKSDGLELYHEVFYEIGPDYEVEMRANFDNAVRIPCLCGCCLNCGYILKFRLDRLLR